MPLSGFRELNERLVDEGKKPTPNPRNAAAGLAAPEGPVDHREPAAVVLGLRRRVRTTGRSSRRTGRRCSGCAATAFRSTRSPSASSRWRRSPSAAASGSAAGTELDYEIDGIVIKVDDYAQQERLGALHQRPRWARAFKWAPMTATTRLDKIMIRVGRTGALNPWAVLAPVEVGGVTISRATLHNEEDINRKDIREGDDVIVQRAGDVIPQIVGPAGPHKRGTKPFKMPTHCPLCGVEIVKPEGEAMHRCPNRACPSRGLESLINWVQAAADIDGVGEQLVRRLWELGLVRSLPELYRLSEGAAARARRLRRDLGDEHDQLDRGVEGDPVSPRALRPQHPRRRVGDGAEPRAPFRRASTAWLRRPRRRSSSARASGPSAPRRSPSGSPTTTTRGSSRSCGSSASGSSPARRTGRSRAR